MCHPTRDTSHEMASILKGMIPTLVHYNIFSVGSRFRIWIRLYKVDDGLFQHLANLFCNSSSFAGNQALVIRHDASHDRLLIVHHPISEIWPGGNVPSTHLSSTRRSISRRVATKIKFLGNLNFWSRHMADMNSRLCVHNLFEELIINGVFDFNNDLTQRASSFLGTTESS